MMRGYEAPHGGLVLFSTPSRRQRMARRRWTALAVVLSVALAGAVLGQMSSVRDDAERPVPPGPFSYLP
ncbi:hypothetical protein [Phenylobacterium sp.]|uniref:hypothetical protein n=1 Tax=Phenylobacterium sp. TaxID=1871053 RepID=UPI00273566FA|nr:hypothetical protein [Phenylobacterium sp.]MDP3852817.1 hypothetical protein [Phenylobacterium sp.]